MPRSTIVLALAFALAGPFSVQEGAAQDAPPFAVHPYNYFGDETGLTASVSLGDLDGDGDLDGFAANGRHWIQQDEVFLNNGMGLFRSARDAGPERSTAYQAALADLDGDGDLDAAIARDLLPVLLLFNDGTGHFPVAREIGPVAQARGIVAADFDNDGDIDLVLAQRGRANLQFINDGAGGFDQVIELSGSEQTIQAVAADLDGDGRLDLVFSNRGGEGVMIYRGAAAGFGAPERLGADLGLEIRGVAVGDVTGDGRADIVAGGMKAQGVIFVNDGKGGFGAVRRFGSTADVAFAVALADFDRDGRLDIALANSEAPNRVYFNRAGGFEAVDIPADPVDSYNVSVGDLDQDGWPDLVFAVSEGSNYVAFNRIGRRK
ncbi:MAG: VCBS repeat-containing protein [Caulobacter sp.]|nr:VCBS repeat-containing protein [Caulobacter sp.]